MIVIFSKHKKSHANAWDRNSIYFMSLVFLKTQPLFADIEACYRVQFHNTIGLKRILFNLMQDTSNLIYIVFENNQ